MRRILTSIGALFVLCLLSQPAAVLAQNLPLGEAAPATGNVLRLGHLGRHIGDIERIIHFYHDLLDTGLQGQRNEPRQFFTTPGLRDFANTPDYAQFRAVILPIPGTAVEAGKGQEATVEAIEFRNMNRRQYVQAMQDIGSSRLVLFLRDLDGALEKLKADGAVIVTAEGNPVEVSSRYGSGKKERAIVVRDPDGYPVELVQLDVLPKTTAPADSNIIGARVSLTVEDLEASEKLYTLLVGPELKFWSSPSFIRDEAYNKLWNTPGAEFRYGAALVPGSPVYMEFVQFRGIKQEKQDTILQDIGTAHFLFMAEDAEVALSRVKEAGMKTVALSGSYVHIGPTAPALFSKEINNFFIEFIARSPVQNPGQAPAKAK
ncbi:MAG: hypothetical protein FWF13_00885 [Acidobacteria bacterium]|nr:hypothetical protein [Acidobacteriota bacterium]